MITHVLYYHTLITIARNEIGRSAVASSAAPRVRWFPRRIHESTGWNVRDIRDFTRQYCHSPAGKGGAQDCRQFRRPGGGNERVHRRNERKEAEEELLRWPDFSPGHPRFHDSRRVPAWRWTRWAGLHVPR